MNHPKAKKQTIKDIIKEAIATAASKTGTIDENFTGQDHKDLLDKIKKAGFEKDIQFFWGNLPEHEITELQKLLDSKTFAFKKKDGPEKVKKQLNTNMKYYIRACIAKQQQIQEFDKIFSTWDIDQIEKFIEVIEKHQKNNTEIKHKDIDTNQYAFLPTFNAIKNLGLPFFLTTPTSFREKYGYPLHSAIDDGHFEKALFLIEKGADIDQAHPTLKKTPYEMALEQSCALIERYSIKLPSDFLDEEQQYLFMSAQFNDLEKTFNDKLQDLLRDSYPIRLLLQTLINKQPKVKIDDFKELDDTTKKTFKIIEKGVQKFKQGRRHSSP